MYNLKYGKNLLFLYDFNKNYLKEEMNKKFNI